MTFITAVEVMTSALNDVTGYGINTGRWFWKSKRDELMKRDGEAKAALIKIWEIWDEKM